MRQIAAEATDQGSSFVEVPEVNLPEELADLAEAATLDGVAGCVDDPCTLGFPANDIRPVANSSFLEENPAVRTLLETMSIAIEDIFAQNAKMNAGEGDPEDVYRHASEWIEANGYLCRIRGRSAHHAKHVSGVPEALVRHDRRATLFSAQKRRRENGGRGNEMESRLPIITVRQTGQVTPAKPSIRITKWEEVPFSLLGKPDADAH